MSATTNTKPRAIICDLDGTLSDCSWRQHYISKELHVGDLVKIKGIVKSKTYIVTGFKDNLVRLNTDWGIGTFEIPVNLKKIKQWDKFFSSCDQDKVIQQTMYILSRIDLPIVFCSGRPEKYRDKTLAWLWNEAGFHRPELYMRPDNDTRQDYIVKEELYRKHIEPYYEVFLVLDDRQQVVDMWRRIGLTCWQVNEGNF